MSSASTTPASRPSLPPPEETTASEPSDDRPQWLVVRAVFEQFGIPVAQVLEVVRPTGLRQVPGAPNAQLGILNVRGTIVTVLDLGALRTGERAVMRGSIVLLAYGGRSIGLAVERVVDVRPAAAGGNSDHETIIPLDAVALCARFLHSAEETDG